jgi:hypothetical protein
VVLDALDLDRMKQVSVSFPQARSTQQASSGQWSQTVPMGPTLGLYKVRQGAYQWRKGDA